MSGLKIVAALAGAGLFLTLAFQFGVSAILGDPVRQAVGNVEALGAAGAASVPAPAKAVDRPARREVPPAASTPRVPTARPVPAGWRADESWDHSPASSTSRKAGP